MATTDLCIFANDFDTMYSLFNPTDRAQDFIATIYYGDGSGSYQMPVHLEAQATTMIDMMMLIGEKRPDVHGKLIPARIQQGSVVFESAKGMAQWMTLVVSGGVYNPRRGTCESNCIQCYGYSGFSVLSNPFAVAVTATTNLYAKATYGDGTVYDFTTGSSWSSDNTPVATVGTSTGVVAGQTVGSANVTATFPSLVVYTGQMCSPYEPYCPIYAPQPPSGGTTADSTPVITGIDPSDWTAGHTTPVTFSGQYFGTNAPTLSFSPSTGISYTLSSYNDTQIVASVTVATGTPNESVTVNVTNNGYGGNAFKGGLVGQSASSAPVNATVHSPINSVEITVIAWINGQAPDLNPLPSGANSSLVNNLNNNGVAVCGAEIAAWSILRIRSDLQTSADVTYANAWLIKNSANGAPPSTITPSAQLLAGNFRLFHDFGNGGGAYQIGSTPDPCGLNVPEIVLNWIGTGQASQYMGASGTSPSGKVYQLAEGRIGTMGQRGSQTINNGRTVPWVWSVIEFDSSGNPTYSDTAMFPTYSVYVNGGLLVTYNQSSVANFVANDQSYQRTPSQIP